MPPSVHRRSFVKKLPPPHSVHTSPKAFGVLTCFGNISLRPISFPNSSKCGLMTPVLPTKLCNVTRSDEKHTRYIFIGSVPKLRGVSVVSDITFRATLSDHEHAQGNTFFFANLGKARVANLYERRQNNTYEERRESLHPETPSRAFAAYSHSGLCLLLLLHESASCFDRRALFPIGQEVLQ